jgi:hypothetical protein
MTTTIQGNIAIYIKMYKQTNKNGGNQAKRLGT